MNADLLPDDHAELLRRIERDLTDDDVEEFFRSVPEFERTHVSEAPWWVVPTVELPARVRNPDYTRQPVPPEMFVPERY